MVTHGPAAPEANGREQIHGDMTLVVTMKKLLAEGFCAYIHPIQRSIVEDNAGNVKEAEELREHAIVPVTCASGDARLLERPLSNINLPPLSQTNLLAAGVSCSRELARAGGSCVELPGSAVFPERDSLGGAPREPDLFRLVAPDCSTKLSDPSDLRTIGMSRRATAEGEGSPLPTESWRVSTCKLCSPNKAIHVAHLNINEPVQLDMRVRTITTFGEMCELLEVGDDSRRLLVGGPEATIVIHEVVCLLTHEEPF